MIAPCLTPRTNHSATTARVATSLKAAVGLMVDGVGVAECGSPN
jgi:hypothetical protein